MKKIQILGTGCTKCNDLADNVIEAAKTLGEEIELEKISDLNDIMQFGCMTTPGLAIDGQLVSQGKLVKTAQIIEFIKSSSND